MSQKFWLVAVKETDNGHAYEPEEERQTEGQVRGASQYVLSVNYDQVDDAKPNGETSKHPHQVTQGVTKNCQEVVSWDVKLKGDIKTDEKSEPNDNPSADIRG